MKCIDFFNKILFLGSKFFARGYKEELKYLSFFYVKNYDFIFAPLGQNFYLAYPKPDPPALTYQINTNFTNMVLEASDRVGVASQGNDHTTGHF